MTANEPGSADYQHIPPKRKSRTLWWVLGGGLLALLVLGTCINSGVKAFKALGARGDASREMAKRLLEDGFPNVGDPIYSSRVSATQEQVDKINRYIGHFGRVTEYGEPQCTLRSAANMDKSKSGTFADCVLAIQAEHSPGRVTINWVRESEEWKLFGAHVTFTDQSVLLDKAEQVDSRAPDLGSSGNDVGPAPAE
jgi:hypothetical protein